jgi:hypothetical protein
LKKSLRGRLTVHEVLKQIESILKTDLIDTNHYVKRIVTGTLMAAYRSLIMNVDTPAILIVPGDQRMENSSIANHKAVIFPVDFYIVSRVIKVQESLISGIAENQEKTIYEISNEMLRVFASNKNLNGVVRRFDKKWDTKLLESRENDGNTVLKISAEWINDLVPWPSSINNQSTIPINTELKLNIL